MAPSSSSGWRRRPGGVWRRVQWRCGVRSEGAWKRWGDRVDGSKNSRATEKDGMVRRTARRGKRGGQYCKTPGLYKVWTAAGRASHSADQALPPAPALAVLESHLVARGRGFDAQHVAKPFGGRSDSCRSAPPRWFQTTTLGRVAGMDAEAARAVAQQQRTLDVVIHAVGVSPSTTSTPPSCRRRWIRS